MTPSTIGRRIFVVGVPRSGTTLVQSLLAAHSELTSFTETHFFSRHFRPLPRTARAILVRDPTSRLREFLAENEIEAHGAAEIGHLMAGFPPRGFLPFRSRRVAAALLEVLDQVTLGREFSGWVEKTPRHLRYLPFIESLYRPGCGPRFVHVIRGGLDVVASLHRASRSWERSYGLETCVRRWNADLARSLARLPSPADRFVVYEDLTERPEATLQRLLDGLGLGWEPEILVRYAEASGRLVTREETWKAGIARSLERSATAERVLSAEQRRRIGALLRSDRYERIRERAS